MFALMQNKDDGFNMFNQIQNKNNKHVSTCNFKYVRSFICSLERFTINQIGNVLFNYSLSNCVKKSSRQNSSPEILTHKVNALPLNSSGQQPVNVFSFRKPVEQTLQVKNIDHPSQSFWVRFLV